MIRFAVAADNDEISKSAVGQLGIKSPVLMSLNGMDVLAVTVVRCEVKKTRDVSSPDVVALFT
jgi:hypothetical protein